jgi:hypothetical protein
LTVVLLRLRTLESHQTGVSRYDSIRTHTEDGSCSLHQISIGPQKTLASPEASGSSTRIRTQARDEADHQHENAEVEGEVAGSTEKGGDDDESDTNSLFDYDGSDEEEKGEEEEEGNDSDISTF